MEIILVTGLSGSGKSTAAKYLEDLGWFCIDNVPASLLSTLVSSLSMVQDEEGKQQRFCLISDARALSLDDELYPQVAKILAQYPQIRLLFLEAKGEVLLSRYKQTRRNHPLAQASNLTSALALERSLLSPLRELATDIIDTSFLSGLDLRDQLIHAFQPGQENFISLYLESFGYKYGLPSDADVVCDVRFIPNPFYVPELTQLSGLDQEVYDYVFSFQESQDFLERQLENLRLILPFFKREGRMRLNIAFGCTGGHHRSVAMVEAFKTQLADSHYPVFVEHRDLHKPAVAGI